MKKICSLILTLVIALSMQLVSISPANASDYYPETYIVGTANDYVKDKYDWNYYKLICTKWDNTECYVHNAYPLNIKIQIFKGSIVIGLVNVSNSTVSKISYTYKVYDKNGKLLASERQPYDVRKTLTLARGKYSWYSHPAHDGPYKVVITTTYTINGGTASTNSIFYKE